MILRRCNFTRSSPLARRHPLTAAKLPQHPRPNLLTIRCRALSLPQSATSGTHTENWQDALIGNPVPNQATAKSQGTTPNSSDRPAVRLREFLREESILGDWARGELRIQEQRIVWDDAIEDRKDEPRQNAVAYSSSKREHSQEPQEDGQDEESIRASLSYFSTKSASFVVRRVQATSGLSSQQDEGQSVSPSRTTESSPTESVHWDRMSRSRSLYPSLQERFQVPLSTQQKLKLQEIASYNKEHFILTSEFGEKSLFSFDWVRPLEVLQHEAQLDEPTPNVPHDHGILTPYFIKRKDETPAWANDIKVPNIWTQLSFAAFVTHVTKMRPLSLDKRRDRYRRYLSVEVIDACLMSLFKDPNMRQHLTVDAFHSALTFYYTHKYRTIHRARELYTLMEKLQMDTDPRTFAIMLMSAARQKDLALLSFFLVVMVKKGVRPTRKAWLTLLQTVPSKVARIHVVRHMREQGLLEEVATVRAVVSLTLPPEVPNYIRSGQGLESFFHLIDTRYGSQWPSTEIGNAMTRELCSEGLFIDALRVWYLLQARGCLPDGYTMIIFLGHSKRLFDLGTSVEIARHFWRLYGVGPSAIGHELLFKHAWAMRSYNCCKVIWLSACLKKLDRSKINSMLLYSLTQWDRKVLCSGPRHSADEFHNSSDAWFRGIGKLILGSNPQVFWSVAQQSESSRAIEDSVKASTRWEDPWPRDVAWQVLQNREESLAGTQCRDDLVDVLMEAYEMDSTWHEEQKWKQPTKWKIENAISMPSESHQIEIVPKAEREFTNLASKASESCLVEQSTGNTRRASPVRRSMSQRRPRSRMCKMAAKYQLGTLNRIPSRKRLGRVPHRPSDEVDALSLTLRDQLPQPAASPGHWPGHLSTTAQEAHVDSFGKRFTSALTRIYGFLGETRPREVSIKDGGRRSLHTVRSFGAGETAWRIHNSVSVENRATPPNITNDSLHCRENIPDQTQSGNLEASASTIQPKPLTLRKIRALRRRTIHRYDSPSSFRPRKVPITRPVPLINYRLSLRPRKLPADSIEGSSAKEHAMMKHSTRTTTGSSGRKRRGASNPGSTLTHSTQKTASLARSVRRRRREAARRKHQSTAVDFSAWLHDLEAKAKSGYQPLREPAATASVFKETRAKAAIRDLLALDLSQPEVPAAQAQPIGSKPAAGGNRVPDLRNAPRSCRDGRPLIRTTLAKQPTRSRRILLQTREAATGPASDESSSSSSSQEKGQGNDPSPIFRKYMVRGGGRDVKESRALRRVVECRRQGQPLVVRKFVVATPLVEKVGTRKKLWEGSG